MNYEAVYRTAPATPGLLITCEARFKEKCVKTAQHNNTTKQLHKTKNAYKTNKMNKNVYMYMLFFWCRIVEGAAVPNKSYTTNYVLAVVVVQDW